LIIKNNNNNNNNNNKSQERSREVKYSKEMVPQKTSESCSNRILSIKELEDLRLPEGNGHLLEEIQEHLEPGLSLGHDTFLHASKQLLGGKWQVQHWAYVLFCSNVKMASALGYAAAHCCPLAYENV
jgi:hypothetical protein